MACSFAELAIGNIVRRVLHLIREEVAAETEAARAEASALHGWAHVQVVADRVSPHVPYVVVPVVTLLHNAIGVSVVHLL
jgi:hypothetical protein